MHSSPGTTSSAQIASNECVLGLELLGVDAHICGQLFQIGNSHVVQLVGVEVCRLRAALRGFGCGGVVTFRSRRNVRRGGFRGGGRRKRAFRHTQPDKAGVLRLSLTSHRSPRDNSVNACLGGAAVAAAKNFNNHRCTPFRPGLTDHVLGANPRACSSWAQPAGGSSGSSYAHRSPDRC